MLTKNPFRKFTEAWKFLEICNIDYETGYSDMTLLNSINRYP